MPERSRACRWPPEFAACLNLRGGSSRVDMRLRSDWAG